MHEITHTTLQGTIHSFSVLGPSAASNWQKSGTGNSGIRGDLEGNTCRKNNINSNIMFQGRQKNFQNQLQQLVGCIQYTNDLDVNL